MAQALALFPLQLVAYPGESVNLHIFEQRYRDLLADVRNDGIGFAIPTVLEGKLRPLATKVRLQEVAKSYSDGTADIRLRGEGIVLIDTFYEKMPGKTYPGGLVRPVQFEDQEDLATNRRIVELTRQIYKTLHIERELPMDLTSFRTYDLAHYIGLTLDQEYELLSLLSAADRQRFLLTHLQQVRPDADRQVKMEERAKLNGHFRELSSPDF